GRTRRRFVARKSSRKNWLTLWSSGQKQILSLRLRPIGLRLEKRNCANLLCSFALASASGADFVDHFVELLFGLLKFFVSHAFFGLGHNSLEGIHQFLHRGRRFSRLRHYETSIVYLGGKAYCFGRSQSHPSLGYRRGGRGGPFFPRGYSAFPFPKHPPHQPLRVAKHPP